MCAGRRWGGTRVTSVPSMRIVPARGRLEPADHAQQGRLAAPARAEEREELSPADVQRHVVHRGHVAEALGDLPDLDARGSLAVHVRPG